jgi:cell division protein FtsQ
MTPPGTSAPPEAGSRPSIDPRIRQRRIAVRRSDGQRRLRRILIAFGLVGLVVVAVLLLHTPLFSARAISVTGAHSHTSTAEIVDAAGLKGHPPLISVNPGAAAGRVEALPFIASARVERRWPDGVKVVVTERVPKALIAGPGSEWSIVDGTGRTLEVLPGSKLPLGLLVLSVHGPTGVVRPARVGRTLGSAAAFALAVCRTLPPAFAAQVVSVTEGPDGTVSLGLNSRITVLLGTDSDLEAKYEDIAAIIAHASLRGATVIDVTVPQSPAVTG